MADRNYNKIFSFNKEKTYRTEVPAENRKAEEGEAGSTPAIFISKKYPQGTPPYKQGD